MTFLGQVHHGPNEWWKICCATVIACNTEFVSICRSTIFPLYLPSQRYNVPNGHLSSTSTSSMSVVVYLAAGGRLQVHFNEIHDLVCYRDGTGYLSITTAEALCYVRSLILMLLYNYDDAQWKNLKETLDVLNVDNFCMLQNDNAKRDGLRRRTSVDFLKP